MKKLLAVMMTITVLLTVLLAPTQVFASTRVNVSGYFAPIPAEPVLTPIIQNDNMSLMSFTVTQSYPSFGDMVSTSCLLSGTGTLHINTQSRNLIVYTASIDMQFEGTIAGRTGGASITGKWTLISSDGNAGQLRGRLAVNGTSGDLLGVRGNLIVHSDTIEDNLVPYEGYVMFTD